MINIDNLFKDILWPIVILYFIQTYLVSDIIFFILFLLISLAYIIMNQKIVIPKIPGLIPYIMIIILITFIGLLRYPIRLVARDLFYELTNIIIIIFGYSLFRRKGKEKSILKTVCLMVGISSIITLISGILNLRFEFSFGSLRSNFSTSIYSIEFLLPMMLIYTLVYNKILFSKKIDKLLIFIWSIQILINMSRLSIIGVLSMLGIALFFLFITKKISFKIIKKIFAIIVTTFFLITIIWVNIPSNITTHFSSKFENIFSEIDSNNEFNSNADAESNWRGYEIFCSQQLWNESRLVEKLFGKGNGTLIPLTYVPVQWLDILEQQNEYQGVTVLHNTFYTLLPKGGIIAVLSFILLFILNIKKGISFIFSSNKELSIDGLFLLLLCIGMLINAYVIRGMFQNDAQLSWALLFGWLNAKMNTCKGNKFL